MAKVRAKGTLSYYDPKGLPIERDVFVLDWKPLSSVTLTGDGNSPTEEQGALVTLIWLDEDDKDPTHPHHYGQIERLEIWESSHRLSVGWPSG